MADGRAALLAEIGRVDAERAALLARLRKLPLRINLLGTAPSPRRDCCTYRGCERKIAARMLCSLHYDWKYVKKREPSVKRWTDEEWSQCLGMLGSFALETVARRLGRTELQVRNKARLMNVPLHQGTYTVVDIARETGYHRDQIKRAMAALGFKARRGYSNVNTAAKKRHPGWFKLSGNDRIRIIEWLASERVKKPQSQRQRQKASTRLRNRWRLYHEGKGPRPGPPADAANLARMRAGAKRMWEMRRAGLITVKAKTDEQRERERIARSERAKRQWAERGVTGWGRQPRKTESSP